MNKLSIILLIAALLCTTGCFGSGRNYGKNATEAPIKIYIEPTTPAGKQCVMQCKQLKIQQYQLAAQEYAAARQEAYDNCLGYTGRARQTCRNNVSMNDLDKISRDLAKMSADLEYDKCFEECGGTTTYKQKKPKAPKKQSCFSPSSNSKVIKSDGIYVAYANGIVKDTKTGLEWFAGPDKNMDWNEAKAWVENLNIDGGGWRMPTLDELEGIQEKDRGDYKITALLINTTSEYLWVWSGETKDSLKAWLFPFGELTGGRGTSDRDKSDNKRAFAVRCKNH